MRIKRSTLDLWKKRLMVFLASLGVFSVFYIYFGTGIFTVTSYELVGVKPEYKESIIIRLGEISTKKYWGIIPSNKILSYSKKNMTEGIVSILPNTSRIDFAPRGLHTLKITVLMYEPFLRLDDTHAITKEGIIYRELHNLETLPILVLATSSIQEEREYNGIIAHSVKGINASFFEYLSPLLTKISTVIFKISKIEIDSYGDVSLFNESGTSKVMFSREQDGVKLWSTLLSAIDTEPLKTKLVKNKDTLEYLDARFGNKVFYKFTNDTTTAIIQSHATTSQATTSPLH